MVDGKVKTWRYKFLFERNLVRQVLSWRNVFEFGLDHQHVVHNKTLCWISEIRERDKLMVTPAVFSSVSWTLVPVIHWPKNKKEPLVTAMTWYVLYTSIYICHLLTLPFDVIESTLVKNSKLSSNINFLVGSELLIHIKVKIHGQGFSCSCGTTTWIQLYSPDHHIEYLLAITYVPLLLRV